MNDKILKLFNNYLKRNNPNEYLSYYDKKYMWKSFFYENITDIPFLIIISIGWSITNEWDWDSNEGGKEILNTYCDKFNLIGIPSTVSRGYPTYHLFYYFGIDTPNNLRKNWNFHISIKNIIENDIETFIEFFFDYSNKIILNHEEKLKEKGIFFIEHNIRDSLNNWKIIYDNKSYKNDKNYSNKISFILSLMKKNIFDDFFA